MSVSRFALQLSRSVPRRSFVSSVLLTRTWENETVATLRQEAKQRGLDAKGNKATLITRIRAFESAKEPIPPPAATRQASTIQEPYEGAVVPGIPPENQPDASLKYSYKPPRLPEQPDEVEPSVQIPFVPDFWDSSKATKGETEAALADPLAPADSDASLPKIIVVGGSATHHGGGPSHNLSNDHEALSHTTQHQDSPSSKDTGKGSIFQDIAEDLGLPTSAEKSVRELQQAVADSLPDSFVSGAQKAHSRKLDGAEVRGVWLLFGLLTGSWFAGSIFSS